MVVAVDLGRMVNPNIVQQQLEANIVFGLHGGAVRQHHAQGRPRASRQNFDSYKLPRMPETPKIEMHIVKSTEKPGGIGEPGMALFSPTLANALFALTGKRLRKMPFSLA